MITSSSISYVSQMLEEPQNITDADAESIRQLTDTYPYFVPARYMQAAYQHKIKPYSTEMMDTMQLFSANMLMYGDFLQTAVGGEDIPYEPDVAAEPRMKVVLPEPIDDELTEEEAQEETPVPENVTIIPQEEAQVAAILEVAATDELVAAEELATEEDNTDEEDFAPENTGFIRGRKTETPNEEEVVNKEETPAEAAESKEIVAEVEEKAETKEEKSPASTFKNALNTDWDSKSENLIAPIYTEDYFRHQGMHVSNEIPKEMAKPSGASAAMNNDEKSLMVVMSFSEWLTFYKKKKQQEREVELDQKELKTMWQKEKLAAALEEENEEIPENVFEMAVNSITKEENLISESLAEVMVKQGRYDRAIEMYKKLSLRKPQKKAYFARRIEEILKEK